MEDGPENSEIPVLQPPSAAVRYMPLCDDDTIQLGDEQLDYNCISWRPVEVWTVGCLVGKIQDNQHNALTIRRSI